MSSFGPSAQRTVFAVMSVSAVGSGCYAWMARGGTGGRPPSAVMPQSPLTTAQGLSETFRTSSVSCAAAAQPAATSPSKMGGAAGGKKSLKPLVVCGPSGVGKGTLIDMLRQDFPGRFGFSVSHTTRAPRPGEVHGSHYLFSEKAAMQAEIDENKFIEHANVHGNLYGTSIAAVQTVTASDKICILDIDVQGVKSVRNAGQSVLDPHYLFIAAPSMEILEARLRGRGTETEDALRRRLANSKAEMDYGTESGNFEKVLVNDDLQKAYTELKKTTKTWYPQLAEDGDEVVETPSRT